MNSIPEDHQVARIKFALSLRNHTQVSVAKHCGVEPTTVGAVIHGRSRSARIEAAIASLTGLPRADLWPQWHGPEAKKRRRKPVPSAQIVDALRAIPARAAGG